MEQDIAPICVFATNRGKCTIRGTEDVVSPHGMPLDLLDRIMIIRTKQYTQEEIINIENFAKINHWLSCKIKFWVKNFFIVNIRAQVEDIKIDKDALEIFGEIGSKSSLRYATQLLTPCNILAQIAGNDTVTKDEVEEVKELYLDAKRSADMLKENSANYIKWFAFLKLVSLGNKFRIFEN